MAERLEFKAELKQLLHLITHSLYSNREIFLRELISNASDAINRLKFDSLSKEDLLEGDKDWQIEIIPDREAGTLTISDNGIGMSRQTVIENLGTIAQSGTRNFLEAVRVQAEVGRPELIGQFGVGFYSAFMVADKVTVLTRPAGEPKAGVRWESDGQGEFTIESADKARRGTNVTLHLKEDAKEFLDEWRLRGLVKKFSDFIEHPVVMKVTQLKEDKTEEQVPEILNARKAVWLRKKSEVSPEEYRTFYETIAHANGDPARIIHYGVEGALEFKALLFIPANRPIDFYWGEPKGGLRLYVQRVLITEQCEELLPPYLRFVKGVVDSADLPLNVSRELLQENPVLGKIRRNVVGNILSDLENMRVNEFEKYTQFFSEFGLVLKEGVGRDFENRDKLANLLIFESMNNEAGKFITLKQYTEQMPVSQKEIIYLVGESRAALEHAPYLEAYRAKGWDVLFCTDTIDELAIPSLREYDGKPLAAADRTAPPETEAPKASDEFGKLAAKLKDLLPGVKEVRPSGRLVDSAACLVATEGAPSAHLERILKSMGRGDELKDAGRILELNPNHPAVQKVVSVFAANENDPRVEQFGRLFYDQAVLAEGSRPTDPAAFAKRINELIVSVS
ncbi:MAG: molecular chaperone HtpG [Gemmataceae bacterium]